MCSEPRARLEIRLLGTFEASLDGSPLVRFRSAKARALLAYLAVEAGRPHRRAALATLLWGEHLGPAAFHNLRQALANLRLLLGSPPCAAAAPSEPLLTITTQEVALRVGPDRAWVDLHAFDALLAAADPRRASALEGAEPAERLAQAMALYRGPFLAGLTLPDSPEFEEWRLMHQEQRHHAALLALERLAGHHLAERRTPEAIRYARQQLALEPWSEGAHQILMLALALEGQRGAALRQYEACRRTLARELGAAPGAETKALARRIREGSAPGEGLPRPSPAAAAQPPPFVARERELARLDAFLGQALAGQGRVALVAGEAGSGKTALLARFAHRAAQHGRRLAVAGGHCSAYAGGGDPFLPFREILQTLCGEAGAAWAGAEANPEQQRRLWALYPQAAQALAEVGPDLIGRFVSGRALAARVENLAPRGAPWLARLAELVERSQALPAAPVQPEDLFEQVARVLTALARRQPLVLLLDDLQWIDGPSLSLLFHLARRLAGSRILLVGAYRPSEALWEGPKGLPRPVGSLVHECTRQWGDVTVDLDRADGRRFVDALLDGEPNRLDDAFRQTLARHTGGHALFTVELLRAFRERGDLQRDVAGHWIAAPGLRWEGLPPRVEAVIAERLGRLPPEWRRALQVASVEGEAFSAEVVAHALGAEPAWLVEGLSGFLSSDSRLVAALGVQPLAERGPLVSRYRFGHVLFHDYLYGRLDAVRRAHLHGAIGRALESLCRGEEAALAAASPQLARHYEQAGQYGKAAAYLRLAGRQATLLAAYEEAIALFRRGLALLERLPAGPERAQLEKQILLDLVPPLTPAQGWASVERGQLAQKALDLARQQPEGQADLIGALYVHAEILHSRAHYAEALGIIQLLQRLAEQSRQPAYLALGFGLLGQNRFFSADVAGSVPAFRQALALYDRSLHSPLLPWIDGDLEPRCLGMLALALTHLGHADQALSCSRRALALAPELAHPLTEAVALTFAGCAFHALRLESAPAAECAHRLIWLAEQKRLPVFRSLGLIFHGWARAVGGEGRPAVSDLREGLAEWKATGHRSTTPFLVGLLAHAQQRAGALDEALAAVEEALALSAEIGGPHRAEFYRLKGELLLASGAAEAAEACFRSALAEARQHGLRLLELRAAASLARLWRGQGRREEADRLLAGACGRFGEGFDAPDLVETRMLLEQLA